MHFSLIDLQKANDTISREALWQVLKKYDDSGRLVEGLDRVCKRRGLLDEKGTDIEECSRKVGCGKKVAGAIKALVNREGLSFECTRILHELILLLR